VLRHFLEPTRCDERVDRIDGRGAHVHEQLVLADPRLGQVVSQGRRGAEAVEGEGSYESSFRSQARPLTGKQKRRVRHAARM